MKWTQLATLGFLVLVGTLAPLDKELVLAHNYTGECLVDFDNEFALSNIFEQARDNFGKSTSSNGEEVCDPRVPEGCYTYRHRCGSNYINVESVRAEGNWDHIHLSFEDLDLVAVEYIIVM